MVLTKPILLAAYAISGNDKACGNTGAMRCAVLTLAMVLPGIVAVSCKGFAGNVLSAYGRAMRCPVLKYCYSPTRCPVLTYRMLLSTCTASRTGVAYMAIVLWARYAMPGIHIG
eukprot:3537266-Rhodomonas_salina.1